MKKALPIVGVVVMVIGAAVTRFVMKTQESLNQLVKQPITDVDLSNIEDRSYDGSYSDFPVSVTVRVTVEDYSITAIVITKHDIGQGKPAEAVVEEVIDHQSLEVDVISGATYSSKVILLAIRDALVP